LILFQKIFLILHLFLIIVHTMKKRWYLLYILLLTIFDQISKYFFYNQNFLSNLPIFTPAFNTWVSRSLPINIYFVIIISIIMIIVIAILYKKESIWKRATIFLIWWTIWNLLDRILLWWVRDFIQLFQRFPIFNIADTFICTWAALIIIKELFFNKKTSTKY